MSDAKAERRARITGLYVIADDAPSRRRDPRETIDAALAAGVSVVQLRLKHATDRDALELARWAVARTRAHGALLILNDRFDLADLAGADGVHVGDTDLPPEQIPERVRERLLIGLSTHTLEQVDASRKRPVDYLGFGPVFATSSKVSEHSPRGVELLGRAVRLAERPVVAIGGIDASCIAQVAAAGAAAAAVISAFADAEDPARAAVELRVAFAAGYRGPMSPGPVEPADRS